VPLAKQTIVTDSEGGSPAVAPGRGISREESYQLCRCGKSKAKPSADGTPRRLASTAPETARRTRIANKRRSWKDDPGAHGRGVAVRVRAFLRSERTVWNQVGAYRRKPGCGRPSCGRSTTVRQGASCLDRAPEADRASAAGFDRTHLDPLEGVSGPLWLRGGIAVVSADGFAYEFAPRDLMRCGASGNKPFCDGSHVASGFRD